MLRVFQKQEHRVNKADSLFCVHVLFIQRCYSQGKMERVQ